MKKRYSSLISLLLAAALLLPGCASRSKEVEKTTTGIDVSRYQGTIDWERLSQTSVEFAMIRLGYRAWDDGSIIEDSNARYNLQEAQKYGILLGAYFASTAINEKEAIEEADFVADLLDQYAITYPVAYDCEGHQDPANRQYGMTKQERTDVALAFLKRIEKRGYEGMFYSSKSEMSNDSQWLMSKIEKDYKIWVAQYPATPYPATEQSSYEGTHQMWQYTTNGLVPGISQNVDLNVAYFGYEEANEPISDELPEEVGPDVEALMDFEPVNETVTAKEATNLRSIPSQGEDSEVLYTLKNGETAQRIAICDSGWSKVQFNGSIYYAKSSLLTTDLSYEAAPEYEEVPQDDSIKTRFVAVNEQVTPKDEVNLRTLPSVTHPDCKIKYALVQHGVVFTRTGINEDVGWSRVEYNGEVLYCVSSNLMLAE